MSAQGPLVLGFLVLGLWVWGLGLTIQAGAGAQILISAGGNLKTTEMFNIKTGMSCSLPDLPDKSRYHSQAGAELPFCIVMRH